MDRRRRQWVPLGVHVAHGRTAEKLVEQFGRDGLLVWILYLAACKANPIQGQLSFTSDADAWTKLGLYGDEPDFTIAEFFAATGRLKKTRQTRVGRITNAICTPWEDWNNTVDRDIRAARSSRKRAENTGTKEALNGHREENENENESENDHEQQQEETALPLEPEGPRAHAHTQPHGRARETATPEDQEQETSAAAAEATPTDADILDACRRFGADLAIVSPIAEQITASQLADVYAKVERKIARNAVDDVPALFVHLLQHEPPRVEPERLTYTPPPPEPVERLPLDQAVQANARRFAETGHDWPTVEKFVRDAFGDTFLELAHTAYTDALDPEPGTPMQETSDAAA